MKRKVREYDMFGHAIPWNFNGNETHNTSIGGIFSIVINIFIIWYISINFIKLVTYDDDSINTTLSKLDLHEAGSITYDGSD
jgi:hypothetical protein